MKKTLKFIQVDLTDPIVIMCNNTIVINVSKNTVMHSRTKHIPIKFHFLRKQVATNIVRLEYVAIKEKMAYTFTKLLAREPFEYLRQ